MSESVAAEVNWMDDKAVVIAALPSTPPDNVVPYQRNWRELRLHLPEVQAYERQHQPAEAVAPAQADAQVERPKLPTLPHWTEVEAQWNFQGADPRMSWPMCLMSLQWREEQLATVLQQKAVLAQRITTLEAEEAIMVDYCKSVEAESAGLRERIAELERIALDMAGRLENGGRLIHGLLNMEVGDDDYAARRFVENTARFLHSDPAVAKLKESTHA